MARGLAPVGSRSGPNFAPLQDLASAAPWTGGKPPRHTSSLATPSPQQFYPDRTAVIQAVENYGLHVSNVNVKVDDIRLHHE